MSGDWLIVLYVLATISCGPCLIRATEAIAITAKVGDPLVLKFNTDTDAANLAGDDYFTKNGEKLQQTGLNLQYGTLIFAQLIPTDSGEYHFIVNSKETGNKTLGPIILKGI